MAKIAPCLILLLLAVSPSALADSWRAHGYYSRGFDHRFTGHRNYWRDRHFSRWDRGWQFDRPHRGNFVSLSYGNWSGHSRYRYNRPYSRGFYHGQRWGHRNNDTAVLVGGVVLGSLLTQSFNVRQDSYRAAPVVTRRVVHSTPIRSTTRHTVARQSSRQHSSYLLRDLQGDCFEVERDTQGTELRTQVAPDRCEY